MTEPLAYCNGEFLPARELTLSVFDQGIVHGLAVTEMLRTFGGNVFRWESHWGRLLNSAHLCHIPIREQAAAVRGATERIVEQNRVGLTDQQELGLIISATPGLNPTYTGNSHPEPTLYVHSFVLPGHLWAAATEAGQHLAVSHVPQVPDACVPVTAKSRSRLNWHLADADVRQRYPGARAIVLDQYGYVRETSTANIFLVRNGTILTPAAETVLPGVSRQVTIELIDEMQLPFAEKAITIDDLLQAEEIFTTSTPYCLLGVSRLNSTAAGLNFPGPITARLLTAWNQKVGLDIHAQLRQMPGPG